MTWQRWRARARKLQAHPQPLRFLLSRALWHAGVSERLVADIGEGLKIRFYPSSISAALWISSDARSEDEGFLRLVLRPGDTYVDCGANIGHLAIVARSIVGEAGSVTAFEANPRIYNYCVGNLELNRFRDVLVMNVALGDTRGTTKISDHRADDQNQVGEGHATVPMRPLDELITSEHVNLLKIDVEGYELFVLRGAKQLLERTDIVYCELSTRNSARFGYLPSDAEQLLIEAGFVLVKQVEKGWALASDGLFKTLADSDLPATGYNLVAVKRSALPMIEARGVRVTQ